MVSNSTLIFIQPQSQKTDKRLKRSSTPARHHFSKPLSPNHVFLPNKKIKLRSQSVDQSRVVSKSVIHLYRTSMQSTIKRLNLLRKEIITTQWKSLTLLVILILWGTFIGRSMMSNKEMPVESYSRRWILKSGSSPLSLYKIQQGSILSLRGASCWFHLKNKHKDHFTKC